jgi:hypothetical protein
MYQALDVNFDNEQLSSELSQQSLMRALVDQQENGKSKIDQFAESISTVAISSLTAIGATTSILLTLPYEAIKTEEQIEISEQKYLINQQLNTINTLASTSELGNEETLQLHNAKSELIQALQSTSPDLKELKYLVKKTSKLLKHY